MKRAPRGFGPTFAGSLVLAALLVAVVVSSVGVAHRVSDVVGALYSAGAAWMMSGWGPDLVRGCPVNSDGMSGLWALLPSFGVWTPNDWEAFGTCTTAAIAAIASIFAWRQVKEARRLRLEQAQPYVAVYLESAAADMAFVDLVVKNLGSTAAYDVEVSCDPPLQRTAGAEGFEAIHLPSIFPTVVPNQEWRTFFDSGFDRVTSDLPKSYAVAVRFKERRGRKSVKHTLDYRLDLASFESRMWTENYGIHHVAKALRDIRGSMKKWSESGGGISVVVRSGDEKDAARRQQRDEWLARREREPERLMVELDGSEAHESE